MKKSILEFLGFVLICMAIIFLLGLAGCTISTAVSACDRGTLDSYYHRAGGTETRFKCKGA